ALARGPRESARTTAAGSTPAHRRPLLRAAEGADELARRHLPLPALPDRGARTRGGRGRPPEPEAGQTTCRRKGVGTGHRGATLVRLRVHRRRALVCATGTGTWIRASRADTSRLQA